MSDFDSMLKGLRKPKNILKKEMELESDIIRKAQLEEAFEVSKREYVGAKDMAEALAILQELEKRKRYGGHLNWFREGTPESLSSLPKHRAFFEASSRYKVSTMISANQTGKSTAASFALTCHLTGIYPEDWPGVKFLKPINAIAAGISWNPQIRKGIQEKLLGPDGMWGTGMIPKDLIVKKTAAPGIAGAVSSIQVQHVSGGVSVVNLLSYEQGVRAFQGMVIDVVWLDEEPPNDIYSECVTRTVTTGGIVMFSFTPQLGLTPLLTNLYKDADLLCDAEPLPVQALLIGEAEDSTIFGQKDGEKYVAIVQVAQDDVPWIPKEEIERLYRITEPHLRDARRYGRVSIGEGTVFPIDLDSLIVEPFEIPKHWKRTYGLDVGFDHATVAEFIAHDEETDTVYVYYEHYSKQKEPLFHAEAIKRLGTWMVGSIDYAANKGGPAGEDSLRKHYTKHGLKLVNANKSVDGGIWMIWERMVTGKFKVFKTCRHLLQEIPIYRRDDKGKIIKKHDDAIDSVRYALMGLKKHGRTAPIPQKSSITAGTYKQYNY